MQKWNHLPSYAELPYNEALKGRCSWGVFGKEDELGTINLITPEAVKRGAAEIRRGDRFNLCLPLNLPNPSLFRDNYRHHIISGNRNSQDDYLDNFYLQASSQWDALRHVRAREYGFYNGYSGEDCGAGGGKLGIEKWVEHVIAGRGVLIDVARYLNDKEPSFHPRKDWAITPDLLDDVLRSQGVKPEAGDILLIRTGYVQAYLNATADERADFKENKHCAGLSAKEEMAEYLWNLRAAAVCADNPAVERIPGSAEDGSLHRRLIPMLGFALGELFNLEVLAEDCAQDGRYTCYFTGVPLNLPGGVGSPANAAAVK